MDLDFNIKYEDKIEVLNSVKIISINVFKLGKIEHRQKWFSSNISKNCSLCTAVSHPSLKRGGNVCETAFLIVFRGHVRFSRFWGTIWLAAIVLPIKFQRTRTQRIIFTAPYSLFISKIYHRKQSWMWKFDSLMWKDSVLFLVYLSKAKFCVKPDFIGMSSVCHSHRTVPKEKSRAICI